MEHAPPDNRTVELTLLPHRASFEQRPSETIKPSAADPDESGRRALATLRRLGRVEGALELGDILGYGGMGVVRRAEQVALGRTVAVKTLRSEVDGDRAALALLREAWVTGRLEHPNVVPVHDVGLGPDGRPLIVLRRIEGEHWGRLLGDGEAVRRRFGAGDLLGWNLRVLMQVCSAVHFAHSRGVLHRDLKPENVMIGSFGEVWLVDWGIAVSLEDDGSGRLPLATGSLPVAGTPCYMAPEMLRGGPLSVRTDVYLLGGLLHHVLTGRAPHAGKSFQDIVAAPDAPVPRPDGPSELVSLCLRCLDPDPERRPGSAEALRLALQAFLEHRGSAALADEATERLAELGALLADDDPDHLRLYNVFGEVRFGFRQALRGWPGNEAASVGLRDAVERMVRYELDRGDAEAAAVLLGEHDAPGALGEEVGAARAAQRARREALDALVKENDPSVGQRTRVFLGLVIGMVWTTSPLLASLVPGMGGPSHRASLGWSVVFLVVVVLIGIWARDSMTASRLNRQMLGVFFAIPVTQLVLTAGAWILGLPALTTMVLHFALWFGLAAITAAAVDARILPTAVGYLLGFVYLAGAPDRVFPVMAACNGIMTLNLAAIWIPGLTLRRPTRER